MSNEASIAPTDPTEAPVAAPEQPAPEPEPERPADEVPAAAPASDTPPTADVAVASAVSAPAKNPLFISRSGPAKKALQPSLRFAPVQGLTIEQLRQRVEGDAEDGEAWLALLADAEAKGDLEYTRQAYEQFLAVFPDNAQQWVQYADLELRHSLFPKVEALFARCLRTSTSVELWTFYMNYIRRVNRTEGIDAESLKQARNIITKAYEFTLLHIGNDREAGMLWLDYIAFLRDAETTGTWEEQQKTDTIRKVYQRAVTIPLNNVEAIWAEYNHWEQKLNKLTAKKFIGERGGAYMTARTSLREMRALTDELSHAPFPRRPDWTSKNDKALVELWRKYIKWEEENPLQLEDQTAVHARTLFAYRKAFAELRFYPEIWYSASSYANSVGKVEDALKYMENGAAANPSSILLGIALAEQKESRKEPEAAHQVYDGLVERLINALNDLVSKRDAEIEEAVAQAQATVKAKSTDDAAQDDDENAGKTLGEEVVQIREGITKNAQPAIEALKKSVATVWIAQMRFARRAEGIKPARAVFGKARKSPFLTWQVIEANAMMEYHCNKDAKVATNVFELGLKTFGDDAAYAVRYLDFLISTNDDTNARAVFERSVSKIPSEQARPLWELFARYECQYSDLAAIQKLDARIAETYPSVPQIYRFAERHVYNGLTQILSADLGLGQASTASAGRRAISRSSTPPLRNGPSPQKRPAISPNRYGPVRSMSPADRYRELPIKRQRRDSPSPPPRARTRQHPERGRRSSPPANLARGRSPPVRERPSDEIPEGVLYFMSILPESRGFNGPTLPGQVVCDLLGTVSIPQPSRRGGAPPTAPAAFGRGRY